MVGDVDPCRRFESVVEVVEVSGPPSVATWTEQRRPLWPPGTVRACAGGCRSRCRKSSPTHACSPTSAAAAEEAGWDGVFVWDHLWNRTSAPFADPFVTLAAIAVATERVAIGTMVAALPRRRPQLVAQATTSLDRLSGGRMVLGLGLGVDSYGEYSAFGEPAVDDRARAAALDAGIELLKPMLAGEPVPGAGGRTTTAAGVQRHGSRSGSPVGRGSAPGRGESAATDWRGWRWWASTSGHPNTSPLPCRRVELTAGTLDVVLVGGSHPDPDALAAAGATWCMPEILPGATSADTLPPPSRTSDVPCEP